MLWLTLVRSGMQPWGVQTWPTMVILWAHKSNFLPKKVPLQYFIHWMNSVQVLKMLPDEVEDAIVLRDCPEGATLALIHSHGAVDGHIIDVGNGELGNLQLKDMCDIVMENQNSVGPTHG